MKDDDWEWARPKVIWIAEFGFCVGRDFHEPCDPEDAVASSYKQGFAFLWDSINAKRGLGWEANPWVWVVKFKSLS